MRHTLKMGVTKKVRTVSEGQEAAKELIGKDLVNQDDGLVATISKSTIDKMGSDKATKKSIAPEVHANALANVDALFENSIENQAERAPNKVQSPDVKSVRRYWSPMVHDGQVYAVKMTVKEYTKAGNRVYSIEALDIEKAKPAWYFPAEAGVARELGSEPSNSLHAGFMEKLRKKFRSVNPDIQFQGGDNPRGAFQPAVIGSANAKDVIHIFKSGDRSTFAHEIFHYALNGSKRLIESGNAPQQVIEDYNKILDWAGAKDGKLTAARRVDSSFTSSESSNRSSTEGPHRVPSLAR